jgi:fatty-acyl-CoA synthase
MAAAIVFPVNWMLEPKYLLRLIKEANVKAVIALGPTPGFQIWEALAQVAADLPSGVKIWSVPGPGGTLLPDSDLEAALDGNPEKAIWSDAVAGDNIAALVHSGGTTGLPKIVKLSHRNMSYRHWTLQLAQQLVFGEVILQDTPMFHVGGLIGRILPPFASGAGVLIPTVLGARDKRYIANYWKFVEKYRVTRLSAVPTTLAVLAKSPPVDTDLSSLLPNFITGSTSLPVSVQRRFEEISGVRVLNSYGMTENTASIAIDPRDGSRKEGASGLRVPYTQVCAVSISGADVGRRLCGPDEIGMLQIKGPGQAAGYLNHAHEKDARTEDGWLISGDLGRVDQDGFIFVTGRAKDLIIRGGHNIDPALIEEPLLQFPDVVHAAAVGKPDGHAGELPVAYVQLVPGSKATSEEIAAFLAPRIVERAAMPKEIIIIESLPLTNVGKPLKSALRQDIAERTFRDVLAETTGLSCDDGELDVAVLAGQDGVPPDEHAVAVQGGRGLDAARGELPPVGHPALHVHEVEAAVGRSDQDRVPGRDGGRDDGAAGLHGEARLAAAQVHRVEVALVAAQDHEVPARAGRGIGRVSEVHRPGAPAVARPDRRQPAREVRHHHGIAGDRGRGPHLAAHLRGPHDRPLLRVEGVDEAVVAAHEDVRSAHGGRGEHGPHLADPGRRPLGRVQRDERAAAPAFHHPDDDAAGQREGRGSHQPGHPDPVALPPGGHVHAHHVAVVGPDVEDGLVVAEGGR